MLAAIALFAPISAVSCNKQSKLKQAPLTITRNGNTSITIQAELAITSEEQTHGYMERKEIPDGTGMLFIFKSDEIRNFWMKNTPHPLSIAYIDSSGKIRDILDMTPFSLANVTSSVSVRYALEVPQGWFEKNNIKTGDKINLDTIIGLGSL